MLWHLLHHAPSADLTPRVICFRDGPFMAELAAIGVPATVIETGRMREAGRGARAIGRLARVLRRERPDVVVSWMPKVHLYTGPASVAAGLADRAVWWQHNVAGAWLDRAATALPAVAVGCSSHAVAASQRRLRPRRATFVVHPGVEPAAAETPSVRAADLGIPRGRPVVAIVGRLQRGKGQHRLLEAAALLRDRRFDLHVLVVGGDAHGLSPEYARHVRWLVNRLGLADRTTLTGQVSSALPYIALSDVLVSASESEAFGLVLVEAMMSGTPVIAVDAGGPGEIIEQGRSGLLLRDGHPATIAAGIETLLADSDLRRRLAEAGRRRALEHFSAAAMTRQLAAALRAVVASGGSD
jgi:glycosyltransferase involved in cell wall biosynthesis